MILVTIMIQLSFAASDSKFESEAKSLAADLKINLVSTLTQKMQSAGAVPALNFCHINVSALAKTAAGERFDRYAFGRTSHKVRNPKNAPQDWMLPYLEEFKATTASSPAQAKVHVFSDTKKAYLEPLYVGPQCLSCHGSVGGELASTITKLYPDDRAVGVKLGEFRGFIWVSEK